MNYKAYKIENNIYWRKEMQFNFGLTNSKFIFSLSILK